MTKPEKLGPFKIGRVLGRGGMGAVYEGICEADDSTTAIKVLQDSLNEDEEVRLRFEAEIETLKRLRHPNIVQLSGFGMEQGQLYYVMELVNGSSLQQELRKKRFFQWEETAKIGIEMCQALRHAHDRGVIHRDIKPANILLNQDGNVKLSDFGIARFFGAQQITDVHSVIGTLEYMSPEQALANPINSSSDLYSLGCVLYALLTGQPPFSARSLPELLRKHQSASLPSIRSIRHDIPEEMDCIIADLLRIRPEDRPRNAPLAEKRLQSLVRTLKGNPEEIKVLPTTSAIPQRLQESPSPASYSYDAVSDSVIDLGQQTVKPELGIEVQQMKETPTGSFLQTSSAHSLAELPTVAISLENTPIIQHGNACSTNNTQTLRPAKEEMLSDASYPLESPAVKPPLPAKPNLQQENVPVSSEPLVKPLDTLTRFTAVTKTHMDPFEEDRATRPLFSLPMVLASTMLMIIGLTVYYLVQPTPPEVLLKRITDTIRADESEDGYSLTLLRTAQGDISQFLSKYPSHPSAEQVRVYQDELDLSEHERRLARRMQFSALHSLSPVERTYINVLTSSPGDSEQMIDKLHAFIAVFQTAALSSDGEAKPQRAVSNPVEICVELARRRLKKLEQDADEINAEQEQVVRRRLDVAADWDSKDPVRAREIRHGIIELYQHHRWAKELVEEAKQHLKIE